MATPAGQTPAAGKPADWRPQMVALDIDGTLLAWVDDEADVYETIRPEVYDAVHRARAAGAHIVLASGRSPHGMTRIADMLDLPDDDERLWIVASNGAVIFRYPPMDVVHEETFDASSAVAAVLEHHPNALVAVEERGVGGYRVSREFPFGELSGAQIVTDVHEIIGDPVSRVIIRDPEATADDFVELAARLGLHGTDYVVGWTAWMDLSPVGVSKASGLQHVCDELGVAAGDVLAIGDGRNDIEMLAWAGRGVAMGQAVEEVRAAADAVTETVNDNGAATEINRWFPDASGTPARDGSDGR
ncbi:HAD family hydrolase [Nocardioides houyundeii]|uniref:HAD family hydrolase n=1 Tax=Nocardioides houyundeii TaxID=2045452 RepID=UPI000DF18F99|nr:HAD family hydrolase [Nocardioides houyundeii]